MEITRRFQSKLRYIPDTIPGYTRVRKGKGFAYYFKQSLINDKEVIMHFKSLAIPPAWKNVWISPHKDGHLQATGTDDRGRKQYLYHPSWVTMQEENKFFRLIAFGKALPCIRKHIRQDLRKKKNTKEKVVALALDLMEETLIRAGNDVYREQNNSYGLTTLTNKHVRINGDELFFRFRGKKGILHKIKLSDRYLAKQLSQVKEIPGQQLFQYVDERGNSCKLDSGDLNEYIQRCTQQDFTSKDFRTWSGTVWAFRKLGSLPPFDSEAQCKKNVLEMFDFVASKLGNTRSVCKKYYVADTLVSAYESKQALPYFKRAKYKSGKMTEAVKSEKQLLCLLQEYVK